MVIQVTGELSIARETMRPFVQTFVLASEAPKKYYIYNDIFRYQLYDEDLVSETEPQEVTERENTIAEQPSSTKEVQSPSVPEESLYHSNEPAIPGGVMVQPPESLENPSPIPMGTTGHGDLVHESAGGWRDQFGGKSISTCVMREN